MSGSGSAGPEPRWDEAVEGAWQEFRGRLADRLAAMDDGDTLVVEVPEEVEGGAAPYCQAALDDAWLRVEAASNVYLDERYRLDERQVQLLVDLGFTAPVVTDLSLGETNFWADVEQRQADRAAVMMVRALREVYAVLHPVYLSADGLEPSTDALDAAPGPAAPDRDEDPWAHPARTGGDMPEPLDRPRRPRTPDQVREGVDAAVRDLYQAPPEWDEDGDLPLATRHGWVWVVVAPDSPRILLHAPLVEDVADEPRALVELNLLNQRAIGLSFSLREGRISVMRELDATVLLPAQLRAEVERLTEHVDEWALELAARVGGRLMDESTPRPAPGAAPATAPAAAAPDTSPEPDRFKTAYAVLLELEKQERGSVDPATMARVFQQDTGLLIKAVRVTEGRLRDWQRRERKWAEQGDDTLVHTAQRRQQWQRDLRARMRAALRLLVDAPVRRVQLDQLALFDEDEYGSGR